MSFLLPHFTPPDFSLPRFSQAPDAVLVPSPKDKVAPKQYHATTIFPEYFKIGGQWLLAKKAAWTVSQFTKTAISAFGSFGF